MLQSTCAADSFLKLCSCAFVPLLLCAQALELDEHYDNTDDMYCDIADRLEAVEAAAPAASLAGHLGALTLKKDGKMKSGGGKVRQWQMSALRPCNGDAVAAGLAACSAVQSCWVPVGWWIKAACRSSVRAVQMQAVQQQSLVCPAMPSCIVASWPCMWWLHAVGASDPPASLEKKPCVVVGVCMGGWTCKNN